MVEILHQSPSQTDVLLDQVECNPSLEEQAAQIIPLMHSIWVTDTARIQQDDENNFLLKRHDFVAGVDGHALLQPGISHEGRTGREFSHYFSIPQGSKEPISICSTREHDLVNVAQGYTLRVPLSRKPYAFLSMTSCSCLSGVNDGELMVAHVGQSEQGPITDNLALFREQGIELSSIIAVVGIGDYARTFKLDEMTDLGQMPIQHITTLVDMGILEKNIRVFDGLAGVVVTKDYVASYLFDKISSKWGFSSFSNPPRYSETTRDMRELKFS